MVEVYDNWERLVRATLRREDLRLSARRTPSDLSSVSASSSFNYTSPPRSVSSSNFSNLLIGDPFTRDQILRATDYLSRFNLFKHGNSGFRFCGAPLVAVAEKLEKDLAVAMQNQISLQLKIQFQKLMEHLKYVQLFGAEASEFEPKIEIVKVSLAVLDELICQADNLVTDFGIREDYHKMKGSFSFLSFSKMSFRYEMEKDLIKINKKLKGQLESLSRYFSPVTVPWRSDSNGDRLIHWSSPIESSRDKLTHWSSQVFDQSEIVGLTEDVSTIRNWIFAQNEPLLRLGIVGLGGLGKTTLAKMIYRDVNLTKRFQEKIWISVSQPVNVDEIMKSMLKQLKADESGSCKGDMLDRISQLLSDKTYLIVLDDVWSIDEGWWDRISTGLPRTEGNNNCIIITSRIKKVVKRMGVMDARIHQPKFLDDEESWALFCKVAHMSTDGEENPKLVEVGKEMVQKCGGLPLAIKTIGGLLSLVDKEYIQWTRICKHFHEKLTTIEGNHAEGNESVIASLQLSYDELPARLKQCILCFSIYPEDCEIDVDQLIRWWQGEGFVRGKSTETATELALNCLSELINRCLVEVAQRRNFDSSVYTCKVHDMVRDLTIKIAREEDFCSFDDSGKHIANSNSRRLGVTNETTFQTLRGNSKLRALLLTTTHYIGFNRNIELAKVKSLRVLDFSYVTLDSICEKDLWYWITSLKRLAYLNLRGVAKLLEVPKSIGKLWGLQVLILGECKNLNKLPKSILNLPRLIILDVGNCPDLKCLPQGFSKLCNLQELYGFKIAGSANAAGSHLGELKALTELRVLQIDITEESTIQDHEMNVFAQLYQLRVLSINAGDCEDKEILRKLHNLSPPFSIEELYLKHYFGETTPEWINPKSLRQLQYLCLEDSRINKMSEDFWGDQESKWDVKGLCLKFCQRLQLSWEKLLPAMPDIRYLEVSQCNSLVGFPCDVEAVGYWYKDVKQKDGSRRMLSLKKIECS